MRADLAKPFPEGNATSRGSDKTLPSSRETADDLFRILTCHGRLSFDPRQMFSCPTPAQDAAPRLQASPSRVGEKTGSIKNVSQTLRRGQRGHVPERVDVHQDWVLPGCDHILAMAIHCLQEIGRRDHATKTFIKALDRRLVLA